MRNPKPPKFLVHPDPLLKRVAEPIDFTVTTKEELTKIVQEMAAALSNASYGARLGLAAPQIGINKRVVIVKGAVIINPEWNPTRAPKDTIIEGCYSVPGKTFKVQRSPYGWAKWQSIDGVTREFKMHGMDAIIYQHELDHLNGICCADIGEEINPGKNGDSSNSEKNNHPNG